MTQEEKYKLALFAVVRNGTVMPHGIRLGKNMQEINTMTLATMGSVMNMCDFEVLKKDYESAQY